LNTQAIASAIIITNTPNPLGRFDGDALNVAAKLAAAASAPVDEDEDMSDEDYTKLTHTYCGMIN